MFINIEQGTPILDFRDNHVLVETSLFHYLLLEALTN